MNPFPLGALATRCGVRACRSVDLRSSSTPAALPQQARGVPQRLTAPRAGAVDECPMPRLRRDDRSPEVARSRRVQRTYELERTNVAIARGLGAMAEGGAVLSNGAAPPGVVAAEGL